MPLFSRTVGYFFGIALFFSITSAQLCSSINGLGKCSSNVFNCVFQNGFPNYFKANASTGDCAADEFCCLNLPRPEDGSCARRCGESGAARQKLKPGDAGIKLDKRYDWNSLSTSGAEERSARIVNGTDADKYEFCWQGGVFVVDTEQLQNNSRTAVPIYIGGASLVGQDMALTAAHVLQPFITNANFIIFIAFGYRDIRDITDIMNQSRPFNADETPVFRVPNEMAFHSGYNDRTYENNVAIIRFNPLSCETPAICPICLSPIPANPFQPWKGTCYTSGWGATENSSVATTLQKLEMVIPYPNECIKSFMKLGLKNYDLPSTMLCADHAPGQNGGTCDRDGGSPLVCQTKYGNWELTGIVGVGINRCRQIAAPTLFTNVGYYYEWIQSYTNGIYQNQDTTTVTPTFTVPASTAPPSALVKPNTSQISVKPEISPLLPLFSFTSLPAMTTETILTTSAPTTTTTVSLRVAAESQSRFQFSPPKVFLPRPAPPLDEQQKKVLAFFQERTDDGAPRSRPLLIPVQQETPATTTSAPRTSTFAVLLNGNLVKKFDNTITDASNGAVKFIMTAGDGLIRRKTSSTVDLRNTPVSTASSTTTQSTSTFSTSTSTATPPTTLITTSTTQATSEMTSPTTTQPSPPLTPVTFIKSAPDRLMKPQDLFRKEIPKQRLNSNSNFNDSSNAATFTNKGWNKIIFRIRPNQDNPSILSLLRERYKNSKLYTDAPSTVIPDLPTPAAKIVSNPPISPISTMATAKTTTSSPVTKSSSSTASSTVKAVVATLAPSTVKPSTMATTSNSTGTTQRNPVTVVISGLQLANLQATLANMLRNDTLRRRPVGNDVMM